MNPLAKLDQLNLEPAAKTEVAALIQSLIDQAAQDAKAIQTKDLKIGALTHELAADHGALIFSASGQNGLAIIAGSPAQRAGLRIGDIITAVNDKPIAENSSLSDALYQFSKGDSVTLSIIRDGTSIAVPIQL